MKSAEHLLPLIAYADALGLPHEAQTHNALQEVDVTELLQTDTHPYFPGHVRGEWSDDTQQSLAVTQSLIRENGFNGQAVAQGLAQEFQISGRGWGKGAAITMEALLQDVPYDEACGPRPAEGGCGAIMRMAPLIWWQVARGTEPNASRAEIEELCDITHNNEVARVRAVAHAQILRGMLEGTITAQNFNQDIIDTYESYTQVADIAIVFRGLQKFEPGSEAYHDFLFSNLDNPEMPFGARDVTLMTYASFAVDSTYFTGLNRLIHLGGDTDSTAAIFAPMSLALHGLPEQWPPSDFEYIQRQADILQASADFAALMN